MCRHDCRTLVVSPSSIDLIETVKTACDREDSRFIEVDATRRLR